MWLLEAVIACLIAFCVLRPAPAAAQQKPTRPPLLTPGTIAPDFVAEAWGGGPLRLSDLRGRIVVLDFWGPWCPPCRQSMPHLERVHQSVKDQGVVVLGVCVWSKPDEAEKFIRDNQKNYTFRFALDPACRKAGLRRITDGYHVSGIPTTYVLDAEGRVIGAGSPWDVEKFLKKAGVRVAEVKPRADFPKTGASIGLGSWRTQVQYDDVRVEQKGQTIFSDDFSSNAPAWTAMSGDWKVQNGTLWQTQEVTNVRMVAGTPQWSDYTLHVKAKKISGREGFVIMFRVRDNDNWYWWSIGGNNNTAHFIQKAVNGRKSGLPGIKPGLIETNRWYDIRIHLNGERIRCFLDDQLIHDVTDHGYAPVVEKAQEETAKPVESDPFRRFHAKMKAAPSVAGELLVRFPRTQKQERVRFEFKKPNLVRVDYPNSTFIQTGSESWIVKEGKKQRWGQLPTPKEGIDGEAIFRAGALTGLGPTLSRTLLPGQVEDQGEANFAGRPCFKFKVKGQGSSTSHNDGVVTERQFVTEDSYHLLLVDKKTLLPVHFKFFFQEKLTYEGTYTKIKLNVPIDPSNFKIP